LPLPGRKLAAWLAATEALDHLTSRGEPRRRGLVEEFQDYLLNILGNGLIGQLTRRSRGVVIHAAHEFLTRLPCKRELSCNRLVGHDTQRPQVGLGNGPTAQLFRRHVWEGPARQLPRQKPSVLPADAEIGEHEPLLSWGRVDHDV